MSADDKNPRNYCVEYPAEVRPEILINDRSYPLSIYGRRCKIRCEKERLEEKIMRPSFTIQTRPKLLAK